MMSDDQKHIHYTKTSFWGKMFYIAAGAALYWMAFNGGCEKVKSFSSHAMENAPEQVKQIQNSYYALTGKSIDEKVR
jgi:hypothetical protein